MKYILITAKVLILLILFASATRAQEYPLAGDVSTIDGIIKAYYEVVSGPAGAPRQIERDKSLHHPDALVVIIQGEGDGVANVTDLAGYHEGASATVETGFFEYEISRQMQRRGAVAHVWSTYETRAEENGPVTGRGINSIQLYWDGKRWWITSWIFDGRPNAPEVPPEYLPAKG